MPEDNPADARAGEVAAWRACNLRGGVAAPWSARSRAKFCMESAHPLTRAGAGSEKRTAEADAAEQQVLKKIRTEEDGVAVKSCLPPLPTDLAAHTAIWDDVCLVARALAEATPENDCLKKSEILSEEEYYRQRLARVTDILQTYQ